MNSALATDVGVTDRRTTNRFPLREDMTYRMLQPRSTPVKGCGKTLNIGSGGLLFSTEERLPIGRMVEISINWPARLGGTCPLKMIAKGRIVRSEPGKAAMRIERYEFRTRGAAGLAVVAGISPPVSDSWRK